MAATTLISVVPTLVLPFIPSSLRRGVQTALLSFAVGGLLGDVFLHLLPHLMTGSHHNHRDHNHVHHDECNKSRVCSGEGHSKGEGEGVCVAGVNNAHKGHGHGVYDGHGHENLSELYLPLLVITGFLLFFAFERAIRSYAGTSHSHTTTGIKDDRGGYVATTEKGGKTSSKVRGLKISGILNLAADSLHNFTDGIAIGAAFASGANLGYGTALATLLHELPHEIGDYTVLVQSGMSKGQAIMAQFGTAIAAFAGCLFGLLATGYGGMETVLLALTAGGFIYVACVTLMPEIVDNQAGLGQTLVDIVAMCTGVTLMVGVALLE
ncbi:unnamed protein product [Choristocarpus tenellus]